MRGVYHHNDIGLDLFGFSGDGLYGNELTTEVDHVGEVQHFCEGGYQIAIGIYDFGIGTRVFGHVGDFDDDTPSSGGLFKGFHHRSIVLVANHNFVARLPTGAHDYYIQAFCGIAGKGDFFC